MTDFTNHETYRKWLKDVAEEMIEEAPCDPEEARIFYLERGREECNFSEWIIDYSKNQEVLDFAAKESTPDLSDVAMFHTPLPDNGWLDWKEVRMTEATLTLQRELQTELERQMKEN